MPIGLAIETSGRIGSAALVRDGVLLAEESFEHGFKHATELIPMMDRMVRAAGLKPTDIHELYISIGPGSFTGVRIAVTVAKTMALATGVKVVAVPTVQVLIENLPPEAQQGIIVLDAKRDQIFTARFKRIGNQWTQQEDAHLDTLQAILPRADKPLWLIGEGIPYHSKHIYPSPDLIVTPEEMWRARAGVVARIGVKMAQASQFADIWKLTPIYIRKVEAEEKWEKENPK